MAAGSFNTHTNPLVLHETHSAPPFTGPATYLIGLHEVWWILEWIWMVWLAKADSARPVFISCTIRDSLLCCLLLLVSTLEPLIMVAPHQCYHGIAQDRVEDGLFWKLPSLSCLLSTANCHIRSTKEGDISCTVSSEVNLTKFWAGGFLPKCRTWGEI